MADPAGVGRMKKAIFGSEENARLINNYRNVNMGKSNQIGKENERFDFRRRPAGITGLFNFL
jgi:hypothetical protein